MECRKIILVAGVNGRLGQAIINRLSDDVNNVLIAVSQELPSALTRITGIRYMTYTELFNDQNINNINIIINCAYPRRDDANEENLRHTRVIAQNLMRMGITRWNSQLYLNMSCHSVYGEFRPFAVSEVEDINIANLNLYAAHKFTTERLLENQAQNRIKLLNLRISDIIGEDYNQPIIDNMIQEALVSGVVTPHNTRNRYTFINIEDIAEAIERIITTDISNFNANVYNLGSRNNESITTANIAQILENSDTMAAIRPISVNPELNDEQNGEIRRLLDSSRLFNILRWQPEISLVGSVENRILNLM